MKPMIPVINTGLILGVMLSAPVQSQDEILFDQLSGPLNMFLDGLSNLRGVQLQQEMDERGYIRIVDRKKDMIVVSGFKVYPNEIEAVVASHPGVLECAAIGVPDAGSGEAVMLFVVRKDPNLTREALDEYCRQQFTGYKRPKYIEFRKELPKTNVGKILRRELRDSLLKKAA